MITVPCGPFKYRSNSPAPRNYVASLLAAFLHKEQGAATLQPTADARQKLSSTLLSPSCQLSDVLFFGPLTDPATPFNLLDVRLGPPHENARTPAEAEPAVAALSGAAGGERACACAAWPPRRAPAPHEILRPKPRRSATAICYSPSAGDVCSAIEVQDGQRLVEPSASKENKSPAAGMRHQLADICLADARLITLRRIPSARDIHNVACGGDSTNKRLQPTEERSKSKDKLKITSKNKLELQSIGVIVILGFINSVIRAKEIVRNIRYSYHLSKIAETSNMEPTYSQNGPKAWPSDGTRLRMIHKSLSIRGLLSRATYIT
ncbi:jg11434 [Pararge aegeria aegeria]|uniref:Jg11434 protein n=1 Tax=Pararge aegeria aegeria TaxID=348720 RepID=A0A8S4RXX1_9NEOP|nr:jg11434 [Pararge aegeria aegeria]